jgi:hypothetical protein
MPTVSMTTFLDFTAATGSGRIAELRQAKKRYEQDYSPAKDYYKFLREAVEECFEQGWSARSLKSTLATLPDSRKAEAFEECRQGLTKWVGRKEVTAHPKPRAQWSSGGLTVRINPELHLDITGKSHLIKLYFKGEKLSKQRVDVALHLLNSKAPKGTTAGILDLRRSKLYVPTVVKPGMAALLKAEAAAFKSLWEEL